MNMGRYLARTLLSISTDVSTDGFLGASAGQDNGEHARQLSAQAGRVSW